MKIASRFLLPLELFMALVLLSWGLSGWIGDGPLYLALAEQDQNTEWGIALCGIAGMQLLTSLAEWLLGRRWENRWLLISVNARWWSGFLSMAVWLYVGYLLAIMHGASMGYSLGLQALGGFAFSAWIIWENSLVGCLLDPQVPTSRFERTMVMDADALRRMR